MSEPRTMEEWVEQCNRNYLTGVRVEGHSTHVRHGLCVACTRAYTKQIRQAEREATLDELEDQENEA